jgi:hypothetical protein
MVEYQLGKVFTKLNISSRNALDQALTTESSPAPARRCSHLRRLWLHRRSLCVRGGPNLRCAIAQTRIQPKERT